MKRHVALAVLAAIVSLFSLGAGAARLATKHPTPSQLAVAAYARMTPAQRVGQLFMAGVASTGASASLASSLRGNDIGNAILTSDSSARSSRIRAVTTRLAATVKQTGVQGFISTDQEGGEVQRLSGPGFAAMPTALAQGRLSPSALQKESTLWGHELAAAGINLDLAPVADTVPAVHARRNQPIGAFQREYGHSPSRVAQHVVPFVKGMHAAGVATAVKHFPGLGRATGNTDTSAHVTDPTGPHDPYLAPYAAGVKAGTEFVMVSSARYPRIDNSHLACFSTVVIDTMLRGEDRFTGVVISDDLGTNALRRFSNATRAIDFFRAGGTMLLDTSPAGIPAMVKAVLAEAASTPAFAKQIASATMTVLLTKADAGLISPPAAS